MRSTWLPEVALSFDLETTGVDVFADRIVQAAAVELGDAGVSASATWVVDPGIEIPEAASAIHGLTTAWVRQVGEPSKVAVPAIAKMLDKAWSLGWPVIVMNAAYDITLLQAELARLGLPALQVGPVIDPFVIDRGVDPYRRGSRKLDALARQYGAKQSGAHDAKADALTAARVAWAMGLRGVLAGLTLDQLQAEQARFHREWAEHFQQYRRQQGDVTAVIDGQWPERRAA